MRNKLILLYGILLVACLAGFAWNTQCQLQTAEAIYFKIRPVDPRALLSGDYMELTYDFEQNLGTGLPALYLGEKNIVTTQATDTPFLVRTYQRKFRVPHQFYFEEGQGKKYANAQYAQVKKLSDGRLLISALTDENLQEL